MDIPGRQHTFNLGFGVFSIAKFWGDSQVFAEDFSADTVSDDLHIGALQYSLFWIRGPCSVDCFANNALSTFDLEFLAEPNFGRQSSFRRGSADTLPTAISV